MPSSVVDMIQCEERNTWYHYKCASIVEIPDTWYCCKYSHLFFLFLHKSCTVTVSCCLFSCTHPSFLHSFYANQSRQWGTNCTRIFRPWKGYQISRGGSSYPRIFGMGVPLSRGCQIFCDTGPATLPARAPEPSASPSARVPEPFVSLAAVLLPVPTSRCLLRVPAPRTTSSSAPFCLLGPFTCTSLLAASSHNFECPFLQSCLPPHEYPSLVTRRVSTVRLPSSSRCWSFVSVSYKFIGSHTSLEFVRPTFATVVNGGGKWTLICTPYRIRQSNARNKEDTNMKY